MSFNIESWFAPLAAIGVAFGTLAHYFRSQRQQDERMDAIKAEMLKEISDLKQELTVMKVRNDVVWQVVEKELPKVLIRLNTPEVDAYYVKQKEQGLTLEEKKAFLDLLQAIIDGNIDVPMVDDKRIGYLLTTMKLRGDLEEKRVRDSFRQKKQD